MIPGIPGVRRPNVVNDHIIKNNKTWNNMINDFSFHLWSTTQKILQKYSSNL